MFDFQVVIQRSHKNKTLNQLIEVYSPVFGEFYRYHLCLFAENLSMAISEMRIEDALEDPNSFIEKQTVCLFTELHALSIKTLIADLSIMRDQGKLEGTDSNERYVSYCKMLSCESHHKRLQNEYPILFEIINQRITYRLNYLKEIIAHFVQNKREIVKEFGIKETAKIQSITLTSGDSHNQGRRTALVVIDESVIVYKPHSLSADVAFARVMSILNSSSMKLRFTHLRCVSDSDHGWQEFVEAKECTALGEVKNYYYRIGAYIALFLALKTRDVHYENLIACGEDPFFVDLETLVGRSEYPDNPDGDPLMLVSEEVSDSVLSSFLLPSNYHPSIFNFDLGGISGDNESFTSDVFYGFQLQGEGTDRIRLKKRRGSEASDDICNIVRLNGDRQSPREYLEDILEGFRDAYTTIMDQRSTLINLLFEEPFRTREVLRATAIYAKLLDAAIHPSNLIEEGDRHRLFERLGISNYLKDSHLTDKVGLEISSLLNGDVPYFATSSSDTNLYSDNGKIEGYFRRTMQEAVEKRLSIMSKRDMSKQTYYIHLAISTLKSSVDVHERYCPTEKRSVPVYVEIADAILEKLVWDDCQSQCFMLINTLDPGSVKYTGIDYSLYCGGGIALFLSAAYHHLKEEKYFHAARGLLRFAGKAQELNSNAFGMAGPIASAYTSLVARHLLDIPQLEEVAIQEVSTLADGIRANESLMKEAKLDFVTGISGSIVMLFKMYEQTRRNEFLELAEFLSYELLEKTNRISDIETLGIGVAHGCSGIIWALGLASKYCGKEFFKKAEELLALTNKLISESTEQHGYSVAWCNGISGMIVSRIDIMKPSTFCDDVLFPETIWRELGKSVECYENLFDHSLCHGLIGTAACLKEIVSSVYLPDVLSKRLISFIDCVYKDLLSKGIAFGHKDLFEDYSFMLGLSGIGYELIRQESKECPNILRFDIVSE